MVKKVLFVCVVVLAVVVCAVPTVTQAQDNPGLRMRTGLQAYEGDGWWFYYPEQATLEVISPTELTLNGPVVQFRHFEYETMYEGPAYVLGVAVYDNPERVFPEVWAQEQILADWRAAEAAGGPNPLPVTEDGLSLDPAKVHSLVINHYPAFKVEFFGGDSRVWRVYVGGNDKIVVFTYRETFVQNDPLALVQLDVYALIMNTLEFAAE